MSDTRSIVPADDAPVETPAGAPVSASGVASNDAAPVAHYLPTTKTGRYFTRGAAPRATRRVWFVLHGYAQLAARMLRHFEGNIPDDTLIVAPEGLSRFYLELPRADGGHMARVGAAWLTREDREHEIRDGVSWLDAVHAEVMHDIVSASGQRPEVAVLAFSQGVATAMRWLAFGAVRPRQFVIWAGGLAQDIDADVMRATLSRVQVTLVAGEHDQFASAAAREKIAGEVLALGVTPRVFLFDGTHQLHAPLLAELMRDFAG